VPTLLTYTAEKERERETDACMRIPTYFTYLHHMENCMFFSSFNHIP